MTAGLCHSDVGVMEGVIPTPHGLPLILGHEASGVITALGPDVTGWAIGDAVVVADSIEDTPGGTHDGAYAEYFLATAARLVKLPEGMDWGQAAAATDAGLAAYTGVVVRGQVKAGDRVGIVGLGGLGLIGARIAVVLGATVYGVEPKDEPWAIAREQGVTEIVHDVSELAGADLDVIIDFAGFGTTTTGALEAVKRFGRVVLVGLGRTEFPFASFEFVMRNIDLLGASSQGKPEHLAAVIDMIASGDLKIAAAEVGFDEIPAGLERLKQGTVTGRLYATLPE
ncbi:zinc-binding dehydrogenase [Kribbia dieselivorans]|uniref:zinc-binding dehydrogenase n=1 Tax=Kribbia dieselivorans TaxID=331526 RepID=UPI0008390994|nr:zinc-binding dehydrogenase [Kribbia dieselivorans]